MTAILSAFAPFLVLLVLVLILMKIAKAQGGMVEKNDRLEAEVKEIARQDREIYKLEGEAHAEREKARTGNPADFWNSGVSDNGSNHTP